MRNSHKSIVSDYTISELVNNNKNYWLRECVALSISVIFSLKSTASKLVAQMRWASIDSTICLMNFNFETARRQGKWKSLRESESNILQLTDIVQEAITWAHDQMRVSHESLLLCCRLFINRTQNIFSSGEYIQWFFILNNLCPFTGVLSRSTILLLIEVRVFVSSLTWILNGLLAVYRFIAPHARNSPKTVSFLHNIH